ncbi:MAG: hypothetical protein AVDCRST_MAG28-2663, partial [uncultured Rubrobacteraceae bacterium]
AGRRSTRSGRGPRRHARRHVRPPAERHPGRRQADL